MSEAVHLDWAPVGHVLQALARAGKGDLVDALAEIAEPRPHSVRRGGPDSWFLVGEAELSAEAFARKAERVAEVAWLVDQSHGRRRLILSGPGSERRLACGVGVDLSLQRFAIGASCETQYDSIGLHLTRTGPQDFEILVGRSFAQSLYEELADQ